LSTYCEYGLPSIGLMQVFSQIFGDDAIAARVVVTHASRTAMSLCGRDTMCGRRCECLGDE
jgi:hypothetical protein